MKIFSTIILLTFLLVSCNCQEPVEHCISCFTQAQIDSVINSMYSQNYINNLNTVHQNEINNLTIIHQNEIVDCESEKDTLRQQVVNLRSMFEGDNYGHIADTFQFRLQGLTDSTITLVNKINDSIVTSIINGDRRISSVLKEGERNVYFMSDNFQTDTTYAEGSVQLFDDKKLKINIGKIELTYNPTVP